MNPNWKKAIVESMPYIVVLAVCGLAIYLNALIVQDTITIIQATIIGYALVTTIIGLELFSLIILKKTEIETSVKDTKIDELEKELERIKNM